MSSWFEQLDLGSLQRDLAKSMEEASGLINNVNKLDILNFDAMAEQEEADNNELALAEDEDESEEEEVEASPVLIVNKGSATEVIDDNFEQDEAQRKRAFIESQKAIQSKMKENSKSIVRKLNYTPDDEVEDRNSPNEEKHSKAIKIIKESPIRNDYTEARRKKEDIASITGSEESELVEISLHSAASTPMFSKINSRATDDINTGGGVSDHVTNTSVEDESEDNFNPNSSALLSHSHTFHHTAGSLTDIDSSGHSTYGNSSSSLINNISSNNNRKNNEINKKNAKKNKGQRVVDEIQSEDIHEYVLPVKTTSSSIYRDDTNNKTDNVTTNQIKQETKKERTKKVKVKAPKNLDFWGVSSTKKTLNFPKAAHSATIPATPGALNNTVPPETPGYDGSTLTVRFSDNLTTPPKHNTGVNSSGANVSASSNNISIGLLSDDNYGNDDIFQDNPIHETNAESSSSSLSRIGNATGTLISDFISTRLSSITKTPAAPTSSSSSASTAEINPTSLFTFFDNVEEEVDLEADPVLNQVKQNKANPNFQRDTMAGTASAVLARLYAGASQTYSGRSSTVGSSSSSSSSGTSGGVNVNNPTMFQIIRTLMGNGTSVSTTTTAPATPSVTSRAASQGESPRQVMSRPPSVGVMIGNYIKQSLLYIWDNLFSTNGISIVTGLLFIYSYYKFQRYGTDAGDR